MRTLVLISLLAAGCGQAEPTPTAREQAKAPAPKPVAPKPPAPKQTAKSQDPGVQPPKEPEAQPEAKKTEEKKPLTLDDALAIVRKGAARYGKEFEAELPQKMKLLVPSERADVNAVLAQFSEPKRGELWGTKTMREHGMAKWVWWRAVERSLDDPNFLRLAGRVWDKSHKMRDPDEIFDMAVKWGEMNRVEQSGLSSAFGRVERGEGCTKGERDQLIYFAGEEWFANARR